MSLLADLRVRVGADISEFQTKMGMVKGEVGGMGALDKVASVGIIGLAAVIAGVGVVSLKMAGDFQQATTQLVTGAGESNSALESVRAGILKMAPEVGQMPIDLAKGLFMIESAGYHGAAGLAVLKVSAEGAKVGGADLATTSNAVTTVMKDYGISAANAGDATNFLVSVVAQGKTHMEDLAGSLSNVLPTASALHIPLDQVGGAMAALTARGVPASQAATYLRFSMMSLAAETPKGAAALKDIGLTSTEVGDTLTTKGLLPALQLINDHLKTKFPQGGAAMFAALKDITGGARGLGAALGLTNDNLDNFTQSTGNVSKAIKDGHGNVIGWTQASGDLNVQVDKLKATLAAAATTIGMNMIPAVSKLAKDDMPGLISATGWLASNLGTIVPVLGGVIGLFVAWKVALAAHAVAVGIWTLAQGVATVAMGAWDLVLGLTTVEQWGLNAAMLANPIGLIIIALVALVAIGILLVTHWTQVKQFFETIWNPIVTHFKEQWQAMSDFLTGVWDGIKKFAAVSWAAIKANIVNPITDAWNWLSGAWNGITNDVRNAWNGIANFAAVSWNAIKANIINPVAGVASALGGVWNGIVSGAQGAWNGLLNFAGDIFGRIKNAILSPFQNLHIPLPHFNIGSQHIGVGPAAVDIPTVDIKWYAKGGIFDKPTMLGGGAGVGDAGPEAAAPISELAKYLPKQDNKELVAAINAVERAVTDGRVRTGGNLDKNALLRALGSLMADYEYANTRGLMRPV